MWWPVILMAWSLVSLAMLAWMPWCTARRDEIDRRADAVTQARADLPRNVSPLTPERCSLCTPSGRHARIQLCPACALLCDVFPEQAVRRPGDGRQGTP